jgi:hypothetical protein
MFRSMPKSQIEMGCETDPPLPGAYPGSWYWLGGGDACEDAAARGGHGRRHVSRGSRLCECVGLRVGVAHVTQGRGALSKMSFGKSGF